MYDILKMSEIGEKIYYKDLLLKSVDDHDLGKTFHVGNFK